MKVKTACPTCDKAFRVPSVLVGKKAKCSQCGTRFVIKEAPEDVDLSNWESESFYEKDIPDPVAPRLEFREVNASVPPAPVAPAKNEQESIEDSSGSSSDSDFPFARIILTILLFGSHIFMALGTSHHSVGIYSLDSLDSLVLVIPFIALSRKWGLLETRRDLVASWVGWGFMLLAYSSVTLFGLINVCTTNQKEKVVSLLDDTLISK